ncbi:MAG: sodium-dependent bicarbonate transport family permease [Burkholderiales bacterium]
MFFILGLGAGLLRSDLRLPPAAYELFSILLLLTIGLKGGVELANQPLWELLPKATIVVLLGFMLPLMLYPLLRYAGRLGRADAASVAAHYGSVSVGTFAVAVAYLASRNIPFEEYMPVFLVLLETPAILVGILLARGITRDTRWRPLAREIFLSKSIVLLFGGLVIGWIAGPQGIKPIEGLFFDLFKGVLALFLLEMGLICAGQFGGLRRHGLFLIAFGIVTPIAAGTLGAAVAWMMGLSVGGTVLLAALAGSASYIVAPAAMRLAVPQANPTLSLTASLGITFPFNIVLGIPIYHRIAGQFHLI